MDEQDPRAVRTKHLGREVIGWHGQEQIHGSEVLHSRRVPEGGVEAQVFGAQVVADALRQLDDTVAFSGQHPSSATSSFFVDVDREFGDDGRHVDHGVAHGHQLHLQTQKIPS